MSRVGKQLRRASDKLAFVIVQQMQDVAQGRGPGREAQLADALDAYGRAIAFLDEAPTPAAEEVVKRAS